MVGKRILAEVVLALHGLVVAFLVFGLLVPSWWKFYLAVLLITLVTYPIFRGCVLSQIEFELRKQINPSVNYDATWLGYYAPGPLKKLPNIFWEVGSSVFLLVALGVVFYAHFLS